MLFVFGDLALNAKAVQTPKSGELPLSLRASFFLFSSLFAPLFAVPFHSITSNQLNFCFVFPSLREMECKAFGKEYRIRKQRMRRNAERTALRLKVVIERSSDAAGAAADGRRPRVSRRTEQESKRIAPMRHVLCRPSTQKSEQAEEE